MIQHIVTRCSTFESRKIIKHIAPRIIVLSNLLLSYGENNNTQITVCFQITLSSLIFGCRGSNGLSLLPGMI
jgi:hypothetical protein